MKNISKLFIAVIVVLSIFTQSFAFANDVIIEETIVEETVLSEEAAVTEEEMEIGEETVVCSSIFTSMEDFSAAIRNSKINDSHRFYRMPGYILLDFQLPQTTEKISKIYLDVVCKASGTATMYLMPDELGLTRDDSGKITDNATTVITKLSDTLKDYEMLNIGTFECEAGSWDPARAEIGKTGLTAFREMLAQGKTHAVLCLAAPLSGNLDLVHLDIRNGGSVNVKPELTFEYFKRPVATVNGLTGIPFENTDLIIDYTFDSVEYVEGDSTFQWYKKVSEDAEWQLIETETTDTLELTSSWTDCYVKASVIPVAVDDTDGYNDRAIGKETFTEVYGPVWSEKKADEFVANLDGETDAEKFMEKVTEGNVVLELDTELSDFSSQDNKDNVVKTVMNSEYANVKEFQAKYNAAIVMEKIAVASQDDEDNKKTTELLLSDDMKNQELGLLVNRFEKLTDKSSVVDAIQSGSYENVEAFITTFNNNMAVYELNTAGRDNAEAVLNAYDSMLKADIAALNGDKLEAVIVEFLKQESKDDFSQWDSAINTICTTDTSGETEEVIPQRPSLGGGGGGGGGGGASSPRPSTGDDSLNIIIKDDEPDKKAEEATKEEIDIDSITLELTTFNDVNDDYWAKDSIASLAEKGIVSGFDGKFEPERSITREEFVKMLVQAFGFKGKADIAFTDVNEGDWYYEYISIAVDNNIVSGVSKEEFGVGLEITREDMTVMIYRALQHLGHSFNESSIIVFDDYYEISDYARTAVGVMSYNKLVNGVGNNKFDPKSNSTRAMAAAIIDRAISFRK